MLLLDRLIWRSRHTQPVDQIRGEQPAHDRRLGAVARGHLRAVAMVSEVPQAELESDPITVAAAKNDATKLILESGVAVSREAHHLVLVTEFPETEKLADRRVIEAQRMRESYGAVNA